MLPLRPAAPGLALAAALAGGAEAARACSLALVLAIDISSSVNAREYEIQLGGIVAAFRDAEIRAAILETAPVAVAVYEWSGRVQQDLVRGWTLLASEAEIDAFAESLARHRRSYDVFPTAIGRALEFGLGLLAAAPAPCARRVIDISGDGVNNDDPPASAWWPAADALGVTVNGLVIKGAWPDPEPHYREEVIRGPGAFLVVARNGFEDYPDLIRGKLLRELRPETLVGALE